MMIKESVQCDLLNGIATPGDLRVLREIGWTVAEMSRRFRVAEGTIRRALRHDDGIVNVRACLITGDETPMQRKAIYCTPAYIVRAMANDQPLPVDYVNKHTERQKAAQLGKMVGDMKKKGASPALIRLRLKMVKHRGVGLV